MATIDMASSITRHRSDTELAVPMGGNDFVGRLNPNFLADIRAVSHATRNPPRARCGSVAALLLLRSCGAGIRHTPRQQKHKNKKKKKNYKQKNTKKIKLKFNLISDVFWRSASPEARTRCG